MNIRRSVEGVDKSIGEDTSHSSGSYTSKRKYYILNIDNTKNNGPKLDYKSRSSKPNTMSIEQDMTVN